MVSEFSRKRINLGVLYGFTAGLFFTLAGWGMDAIVLSRYHASLPFLKFFSRTVYLPAGRGSGGLPDREIRKWIGEPASVDGFSRFVYLSGHKPPHKILALVVQQDQT
jgi:hypothetical protein